MQATTDGLRRLFAQRWSLLRPLRNAGLDLTNRLPMAKSLLVRYALGAI